MFPLRDDNPTDLWPVITVLLIGATGAVWWWVQGGGLADRIGLLIGIAPLGSARSALWIRKHLYGAIMPDAIVARLEAASDPKVEGEAICLDLLQELASIPGVAGAHVMPIANAAIVPGILRRFRAARSAKI